MPDCFISYSNEDEKFAESVRKELEIHEITTFMASVSISPGQSWPREIMENLKNSKYVILLASQAACLSPFVNQEIGSALYDNKKLVPIVWDMDPSKLPGWAKNVQAIDIRGQTIVELQRQIASIAQHIKQDKNQLLLILGAIALVFFVCSRE